ncbi:MAG: mannitol dehydrogenase family protein [Acidimicrobiales bacterium]
MSAEPHGVLLQSAALQSLDPSIRVPSYDRSRLRPGIVHIGVGGFHRAHLATYVDELCRSGHLDWAITGAGILPHDRAMADALGAQDCLYSLITRGPATTHVDVIGSIVDYIHAAGSADSLITTIANTSTQIVSLTVTEGGYPIDDLSGSYLPESSTAGPASAFGIIAAGLARRRERGAGGITVLSCDNILSNGDAARASTLGEAERLSPGLAEWIASSTAFPNSMVDRITPATTEGDRAWLAETLGLIDRWPVVTEPFRQWVIEDTFAADRLPIEELDVLGTTDVEPYELMKLRLLNASHSCLAYLAAIADIETVDAAMTDPEIRTFVTEFLDREAGPVLPPVQGIDLEAYKRSLVDRFSNPAIGDQIARLCLDGSAKFPKFLLPTVRAQLAAGGSVALSALALAGWCEYLTGPSDGLASDPLLGRAVALAEGSQGDPRAFLAFDEVFGADLPATPRFVEAFVRALSHLRSHGVPSAIRATLQEVTGANDGPTD